MDPDNDRQSEKKQRLADHSQVQKGTRIQVQPELKPGQARAVKSFKDEFDSPSIPRNSEKNFTHGDASHSRKPQAVVSLNLLQIQTPTK